MTKKKPINDQSVEMLAQNTLTLLPLAKKRLLHLDVVSHKHHLPYSHLQVLALLARNDSLSVSEISRRLGIAKPNITPLVDRLYEDGLVSRIHDEEDRRVVNVSLCEAGSKKLAEIETDIAEHIRSEAANLSAADFRELCAAFESINRILELL